LLVINNDIVNKFNKEIKEKKQRQGKQQGLPRDFIGKARPFKTAGNQSHKNRR
jgi:hypothetical protein